MQCEELAGFPRFSLYQTPYFSNRTADKGTDRPQNKPDTAAYPVDWVLYAKGVSFTSDMCYFGQKLLLWQRAFYFCLVVTGKVEAVFFYVANSVKNQKSACAAV